MLLCLQENMLEMLRKKRLAALVVACCLFIVFAGCQNKEADDSPEGAAKTETSTVKQETPAQGLQRISADPFDAKPVAPPTEAELNALGPIREENRELLRFMPDNPSCYTVINPARAMQAPYFRDNADVAEVIVSQFLTGFNRYFPIGQQIPFSNIKRMTFCANPLKQKPEVDPVTGQYKQMAPTNVPTSVCVLELNAPVEDLLLLSLFNPEGDIAVESLTPVTVSGMKAYDMLPPTEENPVIERLVFASPTTVVFAAGSVSEVTKVFDSEPSQGAIPSRVLRTDMQNGDLIAMYSAEGVPFGFADMIGPYLMGRGVVLQLQNQQPQMAVEQENALNFAKTLKDMSIRINMQAPDAGNLLQVDMDMISPADAEPLKKGIEKPVSDLLNAMSFAAEQAKAATNIPPEHAQAYESTMKMISFLISTLEELKVASSGNKLQMALKKAAGFDRNFAEVLAPVYQMGRQEKQAALDRESLRQISLGVGRYIEVNQSKFPNYATFAENGTPLLSWRVAILPYIGEQDLYNQFHLNEPWDSEHNRTLIARIPKAYADPSGKSPEGKTVFRMIGGQGSFLSKFPQGFAASDLQIPGGTLLIVTVVPEQSVEWTRPEFVPFDPNTFGQMTRELYAAMFCTGDVRIISSKDPGMVSQLPYWVSGTISPELAAEMARQRDAMQRYQQYQQNNPAGATQPMPGGPMGPGAPQGGVPQAGAPQPPTAPPMQAPPTQTPPPVGQPR